MNKPPAKVMLLGHPIVAVPVTLAGGIGLAAGLYGGSVPMAFLGGAVALSAMRASERAAKYRAWRVEWHAMSGEAPSGVSGRRVVGALLVAALMILVVARPDLIAVGAGYAAGWLWAHPIVLAPPALILAIVVFQFVRFFPRRQRRRSDVVRIVATPVLKSPTLEDAYRALPDYCHALLRGRE